MGQALHLDGESSIVVGVLRPGFSFDYPTLGSPEPADIYVPDVGRICIRIGSERQSRPRANSRNPHEYVHRVNQIHPSRRAVSGSDFLTAVLEIAKALRGCQL